MVAENGRKPCILHLEYGVFAEIVPLVLKGKDVDILNVQTIGQAQRLLTESRVDLIICNWHRDGSAMLRLIQKIPDAPPLILHSVLARKDECPNLPPGVRWVDKAYASDLINAVEEIILTP